MCCDDAIPLLLLVLVLWGLRTDYSILCCYDVVVFKVIFKYLEDFWVFFWFCLAEPGRYANTLHGKDTRSHQAVTATLGDYVSAVRRGGAPLCAEQPGCDCPRRATKLGGATGLPTDKSWDYRLCVPWRENYRDGDPKEFLYKSQSVASHWILKKNFF